MATRNSLYSGRIDKKKPSGLVIAVDRGCRKRFGINEEIYGATSALTTSTKSSAGAFALTQSLRRGDA